ncbi:hypothetical protein AQUCO_01400941v1 [Aquilegia coerulea]|uniref:NAC domain-containing protein n=1 Tax=Aquilegia coerulea TaxID=218851 RepID=A0A2G5DYX7_AQUCA|nr:hypothetical protein AQUCO_01400941v1 [Aquilegia coerulea]
MMMRETDAEADLNLPPGFRFHPTDEELVLHYLCRKISYQTLPVPIIAEIDLYRYNPCQLPDMALFGTKEWYFFTPRDRKYPNGSRPNRAAGTGYWKATGADKPIRPTGSARHLGIKKALVFYSGKAPKGIKTNWIMHEYRLAEPNRPTNTKGGSLRLDDWVLCRIYNKKNNWHTTRIFKEDSPVNSFQAVEEGGSDSFTTSESDVDNDTYTELNNDGLAQANPFQALDSMQQTTTEVKGVSHMGECMKSEDNDWFMDLNLDDLQNSISAFGASQDLNCLDYSSVGFTFSTLPDQPTSLLEHMNISA